MGPRSKRRNGMGTVQQRGNEALAELPVEASLECLHGSCEAVGIFWLPKGCAVYPDVETQVLCWQHAAGGGDVQGIGMIQDLTTGWFKEWWVKSGRSFGERTQNGFVHE